MPEGGERVGGVVVKNVIYDPLDSTRHDATARHRAAAAATLLATFFCAESAIKRV